MRTQSLLVPGDRSSTPTTPALGRVGIVVADTRSRAKLAAHWSGCGYEIIAPATPLDAIITLQRLEGIVDCVVIANDAGWATGLHELISDEFPGVRTIAGVAD